MLLSRLLADFTRGESDALRKAMGKKKKDIVDAMKPKFIEGGKRNGHDPAVLEKIWGDWEKFASYAFNKSHAACYSWVSYQTAYLKANYPAEFMAALLTRRSSDIKEITKLMDECRNMGLRTLGPDVNESHLHFAVNKVGDIRFGLAGVKGLGESAVRAIMTERDANGPFVDVFDFVERVNLNTVNRKCIECLILSGAFDCFEGLCREQYFAPSDAGQVFIEALLGYGNRFQQEKHESENSLFGDIESAGMQRPKIPTSWTQWTDLERLDRERELISIYLSGHPLDRYAVVLEHVCSLTMADITNVAQFLGSNVTFGGIVTSSEERLTKRGIPFGRVKIEDYSGPGELTLFGESWAQFKGYFTPGSCLFLTGTVQPRRWGAGEPELTITRVEWLADVLDTSITSLRIILPLDGLTASSIAELLAILREHTSPEAHAALRFTVVDSVHNTRLQLEGPKTRIRVTRQLLDSLRNVPDLDGITYKVND